VPSTGPINDRASHRRAASASHWGATQPVDLFAGNPGHPAFLAILDTTVDAAAMSVRDNDAAAADCRTPPSAHGVHVPECPFRQRHLGQSEAWRQRERCPSDSERLAPRRLVARGRQRHAGAVPGGDWVPDMVSSSCPVEGSFSLQKRIHSSAESVGARDCAPADVCAL
jgi:hypothetical protein